MDSNSIKKAAASGMVWKFMERCSSQAIGLFVSLILARLLSPDEFGIVAVTMIFIALADTFVSSGFGAALIQRGRYDEEEFSTMFWAGLLVSLILYCILFMAAPFIGDIYHSEILSVVLRVVGVRLPLAAYNSIQQAYVISQMQFRKFFYSTLSGTLISAGVGIYMAMDGYGVWALACQNLVMTFVDMLMLRSLIPWRPTLNFSEKKFQTLFSFGWRITLTSFIGTLFDQLRGFLIGLCYRPADLAFCNRGAQLPQALAGNISTSLEVVMFAMLAKIKDDKDTFLRYMRKSMSLGSFFVIPLMAIMAGSSSNFITIILTERWLEAVPYMQLVCAQEMLGVLSTLNIQGIKASGHADICLKLEVYKKPVYLLLLLATMWISPLAMVAGNTVYALLGLLINSYPNKKLYHYGLLQQLRDAWKNFFGGILTFILVIIIGENMQNLYISFILQILLGLAFYWLLAVLFHFPGYGEFCRYVRRIKA